MPLELDRVYLGDCLELMQEMPDKSVDLVLTDPPFGITKNRWDVPVPFDRMWGSFSRVTNDSSPMVIFGLPPYSSQLIVSNPKMYRYTWIWDKRLPVGFLNANRAPLRRYETISVFSQKGATYYPQMTLGKPYRHHRRATQRNYGEYGPNTTVNDGTRYPTDIIEAYPQRRVRGGHPTQKPIDLLEYLISTYTQPGDIVLDPFLGSGTTAIACLRTGRHFVGIEKHEPYFIKAQEWIDKERAQVRLSGSPDDGGAGGVGMTGYKIGNVLRGYICFSAGSDREAWDKGRAMSDEACPADHGTEPAQVELYALRPVPATPKCVEQDPSPEVWCPILIGYSDESYPGAAS